MTETRQDLLSVQGLSTGYRVRGRIRPTLTGVSFAIPRGEIVALVGESGSGKSTLANVVLRLAPPNTVIEAGAIHYDGDSLLQATPQRLAELRGNEIAFIPQDPANSLNPVRSIRSQLAETLRTTKTEIDGDPSAHIETLLDRVGIPQPRQVANKYPHELSGGQLQRVLIASALSAGPKLLVADEPTSALDVTVQRRVLDLIVGFRQDLGLSVLLITHDLALAQERADRIVVLERGRVQDAGETRAVLAAPSSEYTRRLLSDVPSLNADRFGRISAPREPASTGGGAPPAVRLQALRKVFHRHDQQIVALDNVDVTVHRGTTHAVVGESGSGKTTIARLILGLETTTSGSILFGTSRLDAADERQLDQLRTRVQLVYQNPFSSLDPKHTAIQAVIEPLHRHRIGARAHRAERGRELLGLVGLAAATHNAQPRRLSGGQRQRVAIARALALEPEILVLDEPTSALDVTVQAQILELLVDLQRQLGTTYILISHDLGVVRQLADEITVLRHGIVVERGTAQAIFERPSDPYTKELIEAVPGWTPTAPTSPRAALVAP